MKGKITAVCLLPLGLLMSQDVVVVGLPPPTNVPFTITNAFMYIPDLIPVNWRDVLNHPKVVEMLNHWPHDPLIHWSFTFSGLRRLREARGEGVPEDQILEDVTHRPHLYLNPSILQQ